MQDFVLHIMDQYGYAGVGLLILAEHIFPPIPSEVILTFGGFMTTCTELTVPGVILVSTLASFVGAWILYGLGFFLDPQRLNRLFSGKTGRYLGFEENEVEDTNNWFIKKGQRAVFLGRCVPIIRSLISIPAGMAKMNPIRFSIYTMVGSLIWNTVLIALGAAAGESWEIILEHMSAYSALVKISLATLAVTLFLRLYRKKRKEKRGFCDERQKESSGCSQRAGI